MNFEIIKQELPVIEFNYDALKASLKDRLEDYKSLVVTEKTLKSSKEAQKELASMRVKIDKARKAVKKEMQEPIVEAEKKFKDLIAMIEEAEVPLKDGIEVFDEQRKEEKRAVVEEIMNEYIEMYQLNSKYAQQVEIKKTYLNASTTLKKIKESISEQCNTLKTQQVAEQKIMEVVDNHIETTNHDFELSIPLTAAQFDIEYSPDGLQKALTDITNRAKQQRAAEQAAKEKAEKPVESVQVEPVEVESVEAKPPVEEPSTENQTTELLTYKLELTGTKEQLWKVRNFLEQNKIKWSVIK